MSIYNTLWYKIWHGFIGTISSINWTKLRAKFDGRGYSVTDEEHAKIRELMKSKNYFILTFTSTHLSNWLVRLGTLVTTGKMARYSHILMNADIGTKDNEDGFKLIEAIRQGVEVSSFGEVFNCDNVCIMSIDLTDEEWKLVMAGLEKQLGKPYDDVFNINDDSHVSCVEVCLDALKSLPDFKTRFPHLVAMIDNNKAGQLTPEMYRDCPDFKVVFETKH